MARVETLFKVEANGQCCEVIVTPAGVIPHYLEIIKGHGTPYSYIVIVSHLYHEALEASGNADNFKRSMEILLDVLTRNHPVSSNVDN